MRHLDASWLAHQISPLPFVSTDFAVVTRTREMSGSRPTSANESATGLDDDRGPFVNEGCAAAGTALGRTSRFDRT